MKIISNFTKFNTKLKHKNVVFVWKELLIKNKVIVLINNISFTICVYYQLFVRIISVLYVDNNFLWILKELFIENVFNHILSNMLEGIWKNVVLHILVRRFILLVLPASVIDNVFFLGVHLNKVITARLGFTMAKILHRTNNNNNNNNQFFNNKSFINKFSNSQQLLTQIYYSIQNRNKH